MLTKTQEKEMHWFFEFSVTLKGLHAILEIVGGFLVLFISQNIITKFTIYLTQDNLSDNGGDFLANHTLTFLENFSVGTQHFISIYLISHGIVKLVLVYGLLKEKLWAYPSAIIVFSLFGIYQIVRFTHTHSITLLLLTALDLFIVFLTLHEYRHKRSKLHGKN